jgi:hypothetical protein
MDKVGVQQPRGVFVRRDGYLHMDTAALAGLTSAGFSCAKKTYFRPLFGPLKSKIRQTEQVGFHQDPPSAEIGNVAT